MKTLTKCIVAALAMAATFTGCRTVPFTDRTQLMLTSEAEEAEMGLTAFSQYKSQYSVSSNGTYNAALSRCGTAIVNSSGLNTNYKWDFQVFQSREQNAFALPGGKVAVYSGLMDLMHNEAELAFVVAHEIAHVYARHGGERVSWGYIKTLGAATLAAATDNDATTKQLYDLAADLGVMKPFSRSNEYEADKIGMMLMAKAGYDPNAAIEFWGRFSEGSSGSSSALSGLMSTHPRDEDRIEAMKEVLPSAMELYNQAKVKRGKGSSL
ncbi:MAG: M48 family metallopeptidase [Akkermansiaceae bacterium]|nr:M48 family metallopeptidase [Akkermansiaceae bacterium]